MVNLRGNHAVFVREPHSPELLVGQNAILIEQFWMNGFEPVRCRAVDVAEEAHHPKYL